MTFETAIYTDVSNEESVDGVSGFGFQAVSEGVDGMARAAIVPEMLHLVSQSWARNHEASEQPETWAYKRVEDRFYFSRGRSTGATISGRAGNQLTQVAFTQDATDLETNVPAQILAATNWALERCTSHASPTWDLPLDVPDHLSDEALFEWVKQDPSRGETLALLTSMLEKRAQQPTILIAYDIEDVLRWFTLVTMMFGLDAASEISLRAFIEDPYRTAASFIAVHPELTHTQLTSSQYVNLVTGEHSQHEVSDTARACSEWAMELDEYDAMDAIALLRSWEPALGGHLAAAAAAMATGAGSVGTGHEQWSTGISAIEGLANNGHDEDVAMYMDEFTESLQSHTPSDASELQLAGRALAAAVATGQKDLAQAIFAPTLAGLESQPQLVGQWAHALDEQTEWQWPEYFFTERIATRMTKLLRGTQTTDLGHVLLVFKPLIETLDEETRVDFVKEEVERAAEHERENPGYFQSTIWKWPSYEIAINKLHNDLIKRFNEAKSTQDPALQQLTNGEWNHLRHANPTAPLNKEFTGWIEASEAYNTRVADRAKVIVQARQLSENKSYLVLDGTELLRNTDVWTAWLHSIPKARGNNPWFADKLKRDLDDVLSQDPQKANKKEVAAWKPLAAALHNWDQSEDNHRRVRFLDRLYDQIPTRSEKMSSAFGNFKGKFRRNNDDD